MSLKLVIAAALILVAAVVQDPEKRPRPPEGAAPLSPVQEPFRASVERKDLLQRFTTPSPLEGHYRLLTYTRPGAPAVPTSGYLVVGRRHLSIHLQGQGPTRLPALQSAYRSYRIVDNRLYTTSLIGYRTDADGVVRIEKAGMTQSHGFRLIGTKLTLRLEGDRVLEFERIE